MIQEMKVYGTSIKEWRNALMLYEFALEEINTKLKILNKEFSLVNKRNPIEHMKSRTKTFDSISTKLERKGLELSIENAREHLKDIAGVRIICSFTADIYQVAEMIEQQNDVKVLKVKDYIRKPKANGYRSLHMLVEIPVFLSNRIELMPVEIQIRTSAMDFWASLEHKIYYKYSDTKKGTELTNELKDIADVMKHLDDRMQGIKQELENNE